MRHVVSSSEVAHLWAHQSQSSARNGGGTFYFDGPTIYSYGSHFPIATIVENARGHKAVFFTMRDYSHTTQCHKSDVRRACHHMQLFFVPSVSAGLLFNRADFVASYAARIKEASEDCARARKSNIKQYRYESLLEVINEANQFLLFWDLEDVPRFEVPASFDAIKEQIDRARERERIAERARAEYLRIQNAELIERWKLGDKNVRLSYQLPDTYLRIEGNDVVTSRGARFPVAHAVRGLRFVRAVVARGEEYRRNGHTFHLGVYPLDRVETNGNVSAGCHYVEYAEIQRIAPQLDARADSEPETE